MFNYVRVGRVTTVPARAVSTFASELHAVLLRFLVLTARFHLLLSPALDDINARVCSSSIHCCALLLVNNITSCQHNTTPGGEGHVSAHVPSSSHVFSYSYSIAYLA